MCKILNWRNSRARETTSLYHRSYNRIGPPNFEYLAAGTNGVSRAIGKAYLRLYAKFRIDDLVFYPGTTPISNFCQSFARFR